MLLRQLCISSSAFACKSPFLRPAAISKYVEMFREGQKLIQSLPDDQLREAGEQFLRKRCAGDPMLERSSAAPQLLRQ